METLPGKILYTGNDKVYFKADILVKNLEGVTRGQIYEDLNNIPLLLVENSNGKWEKANSADPVSSMDYEKKEQLIQVDFSMDFSAAADYLKKLTVVTCSQPNSHLIFS